MVLSIEPGQHWPCSFTRLLLLSGDEPSNVNWVLRNLRLGVPINERQRADINRSGRIVELLARPIYASGKRRRKPKVKKFWSVKLHRMHPKKRNRRYGVTPRIKVLGVLQFLFETDIIWYTSLDILCGNSSQHF